jgi:hypothetical protein
MDLPEEPRRISFGEQPVAFPTTPMDGLRTPATPATPEFREERRSISTPILLGNLYPSELCHKYEDMHSTSGEFDIERALNILPQLDILSGAAPVRNRSDFPATPAEETNPYTTQNYYSNKAMHAEHVDVGENAMENESDEFHEAEEGTNVQCSDGPMHANNVVDNADYLANLEQLEGVIEAHRELEKAHAAHKEGVRRAAVVQVKRLRNLKSECKELASHARSHMQVRD